VPLRIGVLLLPDEPYPAVLVNRLRLRHAGFVEATFALQGIVRTTSSHDTQIILARYNLGKAIKERRSAIAALCRALEGGEANTLYQSALATKAELLDLALPYLGRWSASSIAKHRLLFSAETAPLFKILMDLSSTEMATLQKAAELIKPGGDPEAGWRTHR
jgi:hypothetical protein